jgi:hypothetical protein
MVSFSQLPAVIKHNFLLQLKRIFGPSYFVTVFSHQSIRSFWKMSCEIRYEISSASIRRLGPQALVDLQSYKHAVLLKCRIFQRYQIGVLNCQQIFVPFATFTELHVTRTQQLYNFSDSLEPKSLTYESSAYQRRPKMCRNLLPTS